MTEKILQVKKILDESLFCGEDSNSRFIGEAKKLWIARQICQLWPKTEDIEPTEIESLKEGRMLT